jgi:carbonic anhydrase/acetyltransferase-like protein (isoleucine patch superfamily)
MAKEIAEAMGAFDRIAFLDDSFGYCHCKQNAIISDNARHPEAQSDEGSSQVPLIGTFKDLPKFAAEFRYGFVAIGNPELRRKLTEQLRYNCITPAILVHPAAYVSPSAKLEQGCCIEPNATVQTGATLGTATFVASGAVVRHNATINEYCHVDCNAVVQTGSVVPVATKVPCNSVFSKEQNS